MFFVYNHEILIETRIVQTVPPKTLIPTQKESEIVLIVIIGGILNLSFIAISLNIPTNIYVTKAAP